MRVLNVAEKPKNAKAIANILSQYSCTQTSTDDRYTKNYEFNYTLNQQTVAMVMTSVSGHISNLFFPDPHHKQWGYCDPEDLFEISVQSEVPENSKPIANNIKRNARYSDMLVIWTDCDREGEFIGGAIAKLCRESNPRIQIRRARFSDMNERSIHNAMQNTIELDQNQVDAVSVRQELDIRAGYAFTRYITLQLRQFINNDVVSFGTCQFPTLGFIVDRYLEHENFIPEEFWKIEVSYIGNNGGLDTIKTNFNWERVKCFDRHTCYVLYDQCVHSPEALVTDVIRRRTTKRKPLPLTTIELQKVGTRQLGISGNDIMQIAEELYLAGKISYPRTETDQFANDFDFKKFIQLQNDNPIWGSYVDGLMGENFERPRNGKNNDKAHPPIHPTNAGNELSGNKKRVYEFIVRRYLGCCSKDAVGNETIVHISIACERFTAKGLNIIERNYLDIYTYDHWNGQLISHFEKGNRFMPNELLMKNGTTERPKLLVEADLIALMEKNGIGTDATISHLIQKILERKYVYKTLGKYFIPSTLGTALAEGYDNMGFEHSLLKPQLRQMLEIDLKAICQGIKRKDTVLQDSVSNYRMMYRHSKTEFNKVTDAVRRLYNRDEDVRRSHGNGNFNRDGLDIQPLNNNNDNNPGNNNNNSNNNNNGRRGRGRGRRGNGRGRRRGSTNPYNTRNR